MRKPGKLAFKVKLHGMVYEYREVGFEKLQELWGGRDTVGAFFDPESHTVYFSNNLGTELPMTILHETQHLVWGQPHAKDEWRKRLKCTSNKDAGEIEEDVISYTSPLLLEAYRQIPRKYR